MKKALTIILSLFLVSAMLFAGGPKETKAAENAAEDSGKTVLEIYWWELLLGMILHRKP